MSNGAFTNALMAAPVAQAADRKYGRIAYKLLDLYISKCIKQITGGKQRPVAQAPGGVSDDPLVMVKKILLRRWPCGLRFRSEG